VSIRVMSAGQGYRYLLNSVVVGDGDRDAASALTRYYTEAGTPPGAWIGSGVAGLPSLAEGDAVSEEQLRRLMGHGQDPGTGDPLGRPYRQFANADQRIQRRVDRLPKNLDEAERHAQIALIRDEENSKTTGTPVAGFDLTFSAPKSVSTSWAVSDAGTQALIATAHHQALKDVLDLLERDVAMTRIGTGVRERATLTSRRTRQHLLDQQPLSIRKHLKTRHPKRLSDNHQSIYQTRPSSARSELR
jgi:hypothetical protein